MPIESSIALGVKPMQVKSQGEYLNELYTRQNAEQSNQLNAMKMNEYSRGLVEDEQFKNALSRLDKTSPTFEQDRYNAFALKGIEGVKAYTATRKEEAQAEAAGIETKGKRLSNASAAQTMATKSFNDIYKRPDDSNLKALYADAEDSGLYDKAMLTGMKSRMESILSIPEGAIDPTTGRPDLSARRQAITEMQLEAKDRLGKPGQRNLSSSIQDTMTDPITGKVTVLGTTPMGRSPDSVASLTQQRANQAETARHNVVMETQGKVPPGYRLLSDGSMELITGGPADTKAKTAIAAQSTVDDLASTLGALYDQLGTSGGIVSTKMRGGSNVMSRIQATGAGQFLGGTVGTDNQTARDTIAATRPLLLQAIKSATGMSAKQMDSNVELKMYLAAATDPTKSLESNKAALANLVSLYGVGGTGTPGGGKNKPIMPKNEKMPSANPHANKTDAQIKAELGL